MTKIKFMGAGLFIIALMWIWIIVQESWKTSIEMVTDVFYQKVEYIPINVPKDVPTEVMIRRIFKKDTKMALAISQAENSLRTCDRVSKPNKDGSIDIGVFQVNSYAHRGKATLKELMDCETNIRVAKQIFDEQGNWLAWTVYRTGAYKKFLN